MEEKKQNYEQKLSTEEVKAEIAEVISEVKENREKVRLASKSGELKRNPFVNLDEKGILNPAALVKEWDLIQAKKSSLSSGERTVVQQIVWMAVKKATEAASKNIAEKEAQEKPKAKRTRKKKSEKSDSEK
nr:hypothetical protein GPVRGNEL_GPVRGNEL_CDS_0047 [Caudoviricetes sp.]